MNKDAFYAGKGFADISVKELFVEERLAVDAVVKEGRSAKEKRAVKAIPFGPADLWNCRQQKRVRTSVLKRIL